MNKIIITVVIKRIIDWFWYLSIEIDNYRRSEVERELIFVYEVFIREEEEEESKWNVFPNWNDWRSVFDSCATRICAAHVFYRLLWIIKLIPLLTRSSKQNHIFRIIILYSYSIYSKFKSHINWIIKSKYLSLIYLTLKIEVIRLKKIEEKILYFFFIIISIELV